MAELYIDITADNNSSSSSSGSSNTGIGIWSNQTTTEAFPECICSDLQHEDYSPLYAWFNYIIIIIMLPSLSVFGVVTNIFNVFIFTRKRLVFFKF